MIDPVEFKLLYRATLFDALDAVTVSVVIPPLKVSKTDVLSAIVLFKYLASACACVIPPPDEVDFKVDGKYPSLKSMDEK